ncbi:hypothetical protein [Cytobacillus firmus]|uniref:Uncharacterized protein n=1 Tax=Cytobacillus firmus DS1 TaxID=1307436 RepID=W7LFE0_CYTFI|nr:hypothetical protein [Cytobacillus firmus]EWG10704.1 hypothetical protein PBF_12002 [Cytobacillus firmus DS1]
MLFILNSLSLRPVFLGKDSRQQFLSYQNIHIEDHHFIKQQMPLTNSTAARPSFPHSFLYPDH